MWISKAYAAAAEVDAELSDLANAPSPMEAFMMNMGLVVVLVFLFYVLLILPQQKRFKEHSDMLSDLKKGDRIVTGGGLIGTIEKVIDDKEMLIDLGNGVKVTALRSMIQGKTEMIAKKAANDAPKKPDDSGKAASKKKTEKATKNTKKV